MKFTVPRLKKIIEQSLTMGDIGHRLLDGYYQWYCSPDMTNHPNPYYKLFYLIAKEFKPGFVVELGSYRAGASGHFAVGNPASMVVTVDWHKDQPQQADDKMECIKTARMIPNLFYINKCSIDSMPEYGYECAIDDIKAYKKPIDILFIDAWHDEKYTRREWELYSPLLADEALVICDDVLNNAGAFDRMEEWFQAFEYQKFLDNRVHPGIPMGFMRFTTRKTAVKPKAKRKTRAKKV